MNKTRRPGARRPTESLNSSASGVDTHDGSMITTAELVKRFGETQQQVQRYRAEGMPCTGEGRGRRFPWPASRFWRDERIRRLEREREGRKSVPSAELVDGQRRLAIASASLREMKLAELRGELVPVIEFRQELADALARVRSSLLRNPALSPAVADEILRSLQANPPPVEDAPLEPEPVHRLRLVDA